MVIWAGNFIVVKGALSVLPPIGFTFLRYGLSSLVLLLILKWSTGSFRPPGTRDAWRILLLGALGFGVYQIFWTVGLVTIPAGDSALLIAAAPVFTAIISAAIGTDTLTPGKAAGIVLSFVGVVLVIGAGVGIELSGPPLGFALTLAAAACWATYTAVGARVLRRYSPLVLTTWATVGGTLLLTPIGIAQLAAPGAIGQPQADALPQIVLAIVYSGVLSAAVANIVIFNAVRLVGPTLVITSQSMVPAIAVVLAFVFLGEAIRVGQVVGGAIILAGVALTRVASRRAAPSSVTA